MTPRPKITDADIFNAAAKHEMPAGLWRPRITFKRYALLNFARDVIAMADPVVKDKLTTDDHKPAARLKDDSQVIDQIRSKLINCDCSECSLRNKPILEVLEILEAGQ